MVLPQKIYGPKPARDVPAVLRVVAKRLAQRSKEELAKDEVVGLRPSLEDRATVKLNQGFQQKRVPRATPNDALEHMVSAITYWPS